jgi:hypothetical protein
MVASTVFPASSSIENIPALNFSTTFPNTSMESSLGKLCPLFCGPLDLVAIVAALTAKTTTAAFTASTTAAAESTVFFRTGFVHVQSTAVKLPAI